MMCKLTAILPVYTLQIQIMLSADEPPDTMNRVSQSPHVKCTGYLHEKLPYCRLRGPTPAVTLGMTEHHLHRHIITCLSCCLRKLAGCKYETNESKASPVVGVTSFINPLQPTGKYTYH